MSTTCIDCPSFMTKDESSEHFTIEAAGPMCARWGWVFGADDKAADAAVQVKFSTCPSKMNARPDPGIKSSHFGSTYVPKPDLLEPTGQKVGNCVNCVNFDAAAQGCAANGKTIFPQRREEEARGCMWAKDDKFGSLDHESVGPILNYLTGPMTEVGVAVRTKSAPAVTLPPKKKGAALLKWPNEYESDAPVQEEVKDMIRAYRRVDTRQGPVYLPIFRTDYFGERAELIPDPNASGGTDPSLYVDHAGLLERFAVLSYKLDLNLLLTGEPGVGKTEGAAWLAWQMNMPFTRLPYTEASEPDEFLGSPQYDPDKGTYFKPGLLPTNWQQPGVLLSDEINMPTEAIQQAYRSGNDGSRILIAYGNVFKRHDYCFHVAAMNPSHDFRNIGARPMASADSSRYVFMHMPSPSEDMIRKVLNQTIKRLDGVTPDPYLVSTIIKIGEDLRNLSREGRLPDFWTLRQEIKVLRMAPFFGLRGAYAAAYLDYVDSTVKDLCNASINSHIPSGPDWAN